MSASEIVARFCGADSLIWASPAVSPPLITGGTHKGATITILCVQKPLFGSIFLTVQTAASTSLLKVRSLWEFGVCAIMLAT